MKENVVNITELIKDDKNFNKGTKDGSALMDYSLSQFGAGRSILIDKNNRVIAGNKTVEAAIRNNIDTVRIVETSGNELVAVKRTDIELGSKKGREFALADNVTGNINFEIDYEKINCVMKEVELHPEIWDVELTDILQKGLDRYSLGEDKTTSINKVRFGRYEIVLTKEELEALKEKATEYMERHCCMKGFVRHLIERYNEQYNN